MTLTTVLRPAATEAATGTLTDWEALMRQGVAAARIGHSALAEACLRRALDVAQALFDVTLSIPERDADDRVAALVVSHLNLADLLADSGRLAPAAELLCAAHCSLMDILRDPLAAAAWQGAACRHSRETHAALLLHLTEHGGRAVIVEALRAGCLPFPLASGAVH